MKIKVMWLGNTKNSHLKSLVDEYLKRLKHYGTVVPIEIGKVKKYPSVDELKKRESKLFIKRLSVGDFVVALDESGRRLTSAEFAVFIQQRMNESSRDLTFIIGGAYGMGPDISDRADSTISLSPLTFTHDMARVILLEQLYRAFTIIRGEKYHNP